ncbi:DUF1801 domain-containing protein [Galbibacter sp. PAP.153]|uniref:DUF1801 domain-containing protein n=1 Tax=Galbibacter sp. PAP.153 TaxID=3104623 RepID=UPI0030097D1C
MQIQAATVQDYINAVPVDKRAAFKELRRVILDNLPEGLEETISYGMIGYVVPHSIYPNGYHCNPDLPLPFINIACQKNFIALYHSGIYANKDLYSWFVNEYPLYTNDKLDMGKSCVRFKKIDSIPLKLVAALLTKMTVAEWISLYEENIKQK